MTRKEIVWIAREIVGQMSDDDRAGYTRCGWRDGVAMMLRDDWAGADLDDVLDSIDDEIEAGRPRYTTSGPVRGSCGHYHRTIEAAVRCLERDRAGCRRQGGYSDREVRYADGSRLTEADYQSALGAERGAR